MPPLSHIISCTPTKSNLYLPNSLTAAVSEPTLYRLVTFQVPHLISLFRCLGRTRLNFQDLCLLYNWFLTWYILQWEAVRTSSNPNLKDHPLSAVRDCLFNIFAATLHFWGRPFICNLRMRHAVVGYCRVVRITTAVNTYIDIYRILVSRAEGLFSCCRK